MNWDQIIDGLVFGAMLGAGLTWIVVVIGGRNADGYEVVWKLAVLAFAAVALVGCTTTPHPPPCAQGQVVEIVPATAYQAPGACGPGKVAVYGPVFQATPFGGPVVRASDEPVACVEVAAGMEVRCW